MREPYKTKQALANELESLKQRIRELEHAESDRKRTEEALRENEERYRSLVENASEAIYVAQDSMLKFINRAGVEIAGYSEQEIISKPFIEFIHPDDRAMVGERYLKRFRGEELESRSRFKFRFIAKNGDIKWLESGAALINFEGRPATLNVVTDITERKRIEEALQDSKAQLSNALEMAHLGHWEYDVANDLFTFSDQFYKIFRTTVEQVGGHTMHSAEYAHRFVHPDDIDVVGEETRKAIETTDPHFNRQIEHRMLYADGTVGYITVRFFIIKDSHGRTVKTFGVNQDITERKLAEDALREANEYLNNLIGYANAPIIVWDPQFIITRFNHAFEDLTGLKSEEVLGKEIDLLFPEDRLEECLGHIRQATGGERWEVIEIPILRRDGSVRTILWNSATIYSPDGKTAIATIAQGQDITARERAVEALRESETQFKEIFDNAPIGYHELDSEGRISRVNSTELSMLGYSAEEMLGRHVWEFVDEKDASRKAILDKLAGILPPGENLERNYCKKDGTRISVLIQDRLLQDNDGKITGIRTTVQDITHLKQYEQELKDTLESLRKAIGTTIQVMVSAVETRDPYTAGHQVRSSNLARAIAIEMELPQEKIEGIRIAGSIHDIGKL